jgi:alpha-beta hydrolase superfamily lysophospholipase
MLTVIIFVVSLGIFAFVFFCYFISRTVIHLDRQPVPRTPQDYGMDFQNIEFKAADEVKIKGWLIPSASDKLIIITHVGGLTKYGSTKKFRSISKLYNEDIEFLKVARHLHNEGYWVLMFDFRNHGESDPSPNGGKAGVGLEEYLDVLAAMNYIQNNDDLKDKEVGFVSFCMGANSTIIAMSKHPDKFRKVKCLVAVQPISMEVFVRTYLKKRFTPFGGKLLLPLVKKFVDWQSKYRLEDMSPASFVKDIKVPTMYVQTRNDPWTELGDIVGFYENTRSTKEFFWIEGLNHRFQGYQYFGDNPEKMLWWLNKWM